MILCQTIDGLNSVNEFVSIYNETITDNREKCFKFIGNTPDKIVDLFKNLKFRTLVICGSLLEGFDHPNVSVVGIARNVQAPVIFAQFIGRSFRKLKKNDPVDACIVSDQRYKQREMWARFEILPEEENDYDSEEDSFITVPSVRSEQDLNDSFDRSRSVEITRKLIQYERS